MHLCEKHPFRSILNAIASIVVCSFILSPLSAPAIETTASPTELQTVNLQLKWHHQFQFAGYYAAQQKGFYRAEGLDVNILEGGADISAADMVATDKAQYGVSDSEILLSYAQGKPVVVFGAIFQHSPYILLSRFDSKINSPSDLVGKRVMLGNNQGTNQFKAMLLNEGIDLKRVQIIPHTWNIQDLISGKVDAMSAYITAEPNLMRTLGVNPGILKSASYGIDFYGDTLFTNQREVNENPERVAAFLRATQKGWLYALANKEEMAEAILRLDGVSKRGITLAVLLNEARDMEPLILPEIVEIGHINEGRWQHIAKELTNLGLIKKGLDLAPFIYQPNASKVFTRQNIIAVSFLALFVLFIFLHWYFKVRHKMRTSDEQLTLETNLRQQTERELVAAQAQVNEMFKATAAGIAMMTKNGRYEMANRAFCDMLGYTEDELKQKDFVSLVYHDDQDLSLKNVKQLLNGELSSFNQDKRYICKDQSLIWVRASVTAMISARGKVTHLICVTENINEQMMVAEKLKKSEYFLKAASNLAKLGGWELILENMQLTWSEEVAILHDMQPGEVPTLAEAESMIFPEYRELVVASLAECIAGAKPYDLEFQKMTAKGRPIWVRSVGQAVCQADGRIVRIQGAFQDISSYKKLEIFNQKQSLILESIAADEPLKKILESCVQLIENQYPELICAVNLLDDNGTHIKTGTTFNMPDEYIKAIGGLKIGDNVGSCGTAAYSKQPVFVSDIANDKRWANLKNAAVKHGFLACWSWPIFSSKNNVIGTFAAYSRQISSPIAEQIELISAIAKTIGIAIEKEKSTAQIHLLQAAISRLNDIVLITEAEPVSEPGPLTVFVNDAFERRTGFSRSEIIGKTPRILQGPKTDKKELSRIREALQKWEPVRAELINYKKNGEEFWLEIDIVPIADVAGLYTHWVAVERDITKRKSYELEMTRLNRALRLLSSCNDALMHIKNEKQLINEICRLAVEMGGYKMAWVGYANHDINKLILPAGSYGNSGVFLNKLNISWDEDHPRGKTPGGRTIRERKSVVVEEIAKEQTYPAITEANEEGYLGVISLPLVYEDECLGLLAMYSAEVRSIPAEEVTLLEEMARDLAFGIMNIRDRLEQEKMQAAVTKVASSVSIAIGNQFFEHLVENMMVAADADAGFIAILLPDNTLKAKTLAAVVDGKVIDNIVYEVDQSPCNHLLSSNDFVLSKSILHCTPSEVMSSLGMKDYAGQRLVNSKGEVIGMIFIMKRDDFKHDDFVISTLKIFATRAAAEIERQDYDRHIREQASLLDKAQDAIIVRGMDYRIQFWNKGAERLYGWTDSEVQGQSIVDLIYVNYADFFAFDKQLLETGECTAEVEQQRKDGSTLHAEVRWTLVRDDKGRPQSVLCINTDITQRKAAAEEIQYLAFYDALTGLPNRLLLQDRLQHAITSTMRSNKCGAVLFIDLDNFKTINDTLGHAAGDILLKQIAKRLNDNTRDSDTVSRLGGDEFIIMLEDLSVDIAESALQSKTFAEKIVQIFQTPFELDSHKHFSTPSIGITLFKGEENTVTEILKQADLAMYQAKAAGRNTLRFYDPKMQTAVTNRVDMEIDLREAIERQELLLHYQPQMDDKGICIGAEALLRWQSLTKGMISPASFIPLAEETKLILPIGEWVLNTACETLVKWSTIPEMSQLQLAVNVSVHQFRTANFVERVLAIIQATGANPAHLKLELTESLFVENVEDIITKMTQLKVRGVSFSLDDFGTGYSSLSYLKRLPLDQLKIDQSFVRDVLIDNNDAVIAKSIITLGKSLGLKVIAEGVEQLAQKDFLMKEGCYFYQGYYFSRPIALDALEAFVKDGRC